MSAANEIQKLAALRDAGELTQEEFEAEKAKILAMYDSAALKSPAAADAKTGRGFFHVLLALFVGGPLLLIGGCFALLASDDGTSEPSSAARVRPVRVVGTAGPLLLLAQDAVWVLHVSCTR